MRILSIILALALISPMVHAQKTSKEEKKLKKEWKKKMKKMDPLEFKEIVESSERSKRELTSLRNENVERYIKQSLSGSHNDIAHALYELYSTEFICANLKHKTLVAQDVKAIARVVKKVKKISKYSVIAKLTPNVTDIAEMAKAAEDSGADAVSLVNTFSAMKIDVKTRKSVLGNFTGGLLAAPAYSRR